MLSGTDVFTVEVLTWRGLATYYVLFFPNLETRFDTTAEPREYFDHTGSRSKTSTPMAYSFNCDGAGESVLNGETHESREALRIAKRPVCENTLELSFHIGRGVGERQRDRLKHLKKKTLGRPKPFIMPQGSGTFRPRELR